jgi:hypothetical protein
MVSIQRGLDAFVYSFTERTYSIRQDPLLWAGNRSLQVVAAGAAAAYFLAPFSLTGALIYGVTDTLVNRIVSDLDPLKLHDKLPVKILKIAMCTFFGIGAGIAALAIAGFPLTEAAIESLIWGTLAYKGVIVLSSAAISFAAAAFNAAKDGVTRANSQSEEYRRAFGPLRSR